MPARMVVVGGANVDVFGTCFAEPVSGDSNPGRVTTAPGGVGRNIAEALSRLGHPVSMITALGDDDRAGLLRENCRKLGIDLTPAWTVPGGQTCTYVCINGPDGNVALAVCDMNIGEKLTPEVLSERLDVLNSADLVMVDGNLTPETLQYLAKNVTVPMAADPVSSPKSVRLLSILPRLVFVKSGIAEAETMTGVSREDPDFLPKATAEFHRLGLKNVLITMGEDGVWFDDGTDAGLLPIFPGKVVNSNGCGDAFAAAAASGYTEGKSLREMARMGLAAASITAGYNGAINPVLTREKVNHIMEG